MQSSKNIVKIFAQIKTIKWLLDQKWLSGLCSFRKYRKLQKSIENDFKFT